MRWSSHATANARYGALALRIADALNYHPGPWPGGGPCQHWWFTLSTWNSQAEYDDQWIMRPELVQALQSRWSRCWNDMIERLHINGAGMSIPETVMNEVIAMDLQNGCVYCHRKWDDWLTNPTKTNLPSWEHTGSYSCKSPESWNIMLCCHSCNCSQKPGIEAWIADKWPRTVQCNITLENRVASRSRISSQDAPDGKGFGVTRAQSILIQRLHKNGRQYWKKPIPHLIIDHVIRRDLKRGCVYGRRKFWTNLLRPGRSSCIPSWEHMDRFARPQRWNIALACHSCNSSRAHYQLIDWFDSGCPLIKKHNIKRTSVAPVVRRYMARMRKRYSG